MAGSYDGYLYIMNRREPFEELKFTEKKNAIFEVRQSPDRRIIAIGLINNAVDLYRIGVGSELDIKNVIPIIEKRVYEQELE